MKKIGHCNEHVQYYLFHFFGRRSSLLNFNAYFCLFEFIWSIKLKFQHLVFSMVFWFESNWTINPKIIDFCTQQIKIFANKILKFLCFSKFSSFCAIAFVHQNLISAKTSNLTVQWKKFDSWTPMRCIIWTIISSSTK